MCLVFVPVPGTELWNFLSEKCNKSERVVFLKFIISFQPHPNFCSWGDFWKALEMRVYCQGTMWLQGWTLRPILQFQGGEKDYRLNKSSITMIQSICLRDEASLRNSYWRGSENFWVAKMCSSTPGKGLEVLCTPSHTPCPVYLFHSAVPESYNLL